MYVKRVWLICLALSAIVLTLVGDTVRALPPEPDADGFGRAPVGASAPAALPVSDEIVISSGLGFDPAVAYNHKHDEYLVVWGTPYEVRGRRISGRGELMGSEFYVAQGSSEREADPSVAYDRVNDRYLVTWLVERPVKFPYIRGRFIPWNGPNPLWAEFEIRWTSSLWRGPEVVYARAQEEFLVVWQSGTGNCTTECTQVWGRRVYANDPNGSFPGGAFRIAGSCPEPRRRHPDVAYNLARNEYLVTYDGCDNIFGKRMAGDGTVLGGGEFSIAGWPNPEILPDVAACHAADQYLVAWLSFQSFTYKLYARFVGGDGSPGGVYQISDSANEPDGADVACNKMAPWYLVAWDTWADIWARLVFSDETMDSGFEIAPSSPSHHPAAAAVDGGDPNYLVVWQSDDQYGDIRGWIVGETKPKAAFTVDPGSGDTLTDFQFDASSSSDGEDATADLQVRWDWEDDGAYDTPWRYAKTTSHRFIVPVLAFWRDYTIRLQVKDSYGLTHSTTRQVRVHNSPPVAAFTINPTTGDTDTIFHFDASSSTDPEGGVLQVRWDWEDDGTYDTPWRYAMTADHSYPASGIYDVWLEVKDALGLTAATLRRVTVGKPYRVFLPITLRNLP